METTERTFDEAVESLIMPDEPETEETETEEDQETDQTEVDEEEPEEEEAEADPDAEGEDDEDDETDDDDAEDEAEERPQTFKVKVDGREVEVPLDELTRSYSGQQYIQKGMQEAAAKRKEAEDVFNALQQEQTKLSQLYQQITQGGVAKEPKAPDAQLAQDDPIGYMQERARYEAELVTYQQQQGQLQEVSQQTQRAQQQAMQTYIAEQQQILAKEIPEFADPEKGKKLRADLRAAGQEYGYDDEALSGLTDARAVKVLHDAMRWRKLQADKGKATEKADKARPVVKPKAPKRVNADAKREAELKARVKAGDSNAAIELMMLPAKGN